MGPEGPAKRAVKPLGGPLAVGVREDARRVCPLCRLGSVVFLQVLLCLAVCQEERLHVRVGAEPLESLLSRPLE